MFEIMLLASEQGPLYMKLYRHIRENIQNGVLKHGTKLPSVRSLRQQQRFSKTTIEAAYQMLIEEGYVLSKPRSGLYVVNPVSAQPSKIIKSTLGNPVSIPSRSPVEATTHLDHQKQFINFSLLAIDSGSFPTRAWKSVLSEALILGGDIIHQYGDPRGEYSLRVSLAQYLSSSRGVVCLPEQIIIGSSLSYSIHILSRLIEQPMTVAFEVGGIAQVGEIFRDNGFHIVPFPLHDNELSINQLEEKNIQAIYVTPSHRPTGNPLPYSTRQQLLQWGSNSQTYIIEDDYDGEFRYAGLTIPSLQGLDRDGVVIYIGTFSKSFSPALRLNYMILPLPLVEKLHTMERILSSPSRIDQIAMQLFIDRGHFYRHIRRIRHIYRKKHAKLSQLIHTSFQDHVRIQGDSGGLHLELTVITPCCSEELIELALVEGVRIYGPQNVDISRNAEYPKVYLGFGGVNMEDMERGVQQLREAWLAVL